MTPELGRYDVVVRELPLSPPAPLGVHSWAPKKRGSGQSLSSRLRDLAKSFATWVTLVALAIDALALLIEPVELLRHGAPPRAAISATLAALALSTLFSSAAAIPIAATYSLVRLLGRLRRPWRYAWPLPLIVLAAAVVEDLAPHPFEGLAVRAEARWVLFGLMACLLRLATGVTRLRRPRYRIPCGVLLGGAMVGLIFAMPPTIHREPRDVIWLCAVVSIAALFYPLRRQLRDASSETVARAFAVLSVASVAAFFLAGAISPNYRVYSRDYGRFAERLGRFCRVLLDFDDDGFSPVLGGLDCDDLDPGRSPAVVEQEDGKDRNCNHMMRFADPAPSQRGLAPAAGDPDAAPGEIDRVILISIDCMRYGILSPRVTPNLSRLAERGLVFEKVYAGGARTAISLPLVLRGAYSSPSVASIVSNAGVKTTAIFSYRHSTLQGRLFEGFSSLQVPAKLDTRFRAAEVTDRALDVVGGMQGSSFLWVHYFDAHGPRSWRVLPADTPHFDPLPGEDPESSLYLAEISYVDREVGRLVEKIDESGGLAKTMLIVTSDHGEGFGLRETWEHGQSAFEEIVHVPGILIAPGIAPGHYPHVVSHRDIASTIAGAFGLVAKNPGVEQFGRSWLRLRAVQDARLHLFAITYSTSSHVQLFADAPMVVLTEDHAKFATSYREGISRLYHLDTPDSERFDLSPDFPDEAAHMQFELEVYRDIDNAP